MKNILYTGKGDSGTTTLFDCQQGRISKSASLIEALGEVDELNSYLGVVKVNSTPYEVYIKIGSKKVLYTDIIMDIQEALFIIQAEIAGSKMKVDRKRITKIEKIINQIGLVLPPIKSFTVSGGSILGAELDFSRTLARRVERRVVLVVEEKARPINLNTVTYLNRLSSLLFAMSRYVNYFFQIEESHPKYK